MADVRKGEGIAKLTRSGDFETWKFRMEIYLQGLGLFSIVDGTEIAPPDPAAVMTTSAKGKEPESSSEQTVDRNVIREWREYRTRRDMATATIIQALTDELTMKYRKKELRSDPAKL